MYMHYHTQAYIDELHRRADHAHLVAEASHQPRSRSVFRLAQNALGRALIVLGSRLSQPACVAVEPATVCTVSSGGTTLILSECA